MTPIEPKHIRYIKLGAGGCWEKPSIERGEIHFGHKSVPHELCQKGDWEAVVQLLVAEGRILRTARQTTREIRDFYLLGRECLWITFVDGHLRWAFAHPEVTWLGPEEDGQGARMRRTLDGWHKTDISGDPLRMDRLSTRLTKVAAYRRTLCRVEAEAYLVRRISGEEEPVIAQACAARAAMIGAASQMIAGLHWADFETLVDLIFARAGWQRVSKLGGTQKDIDLALEHPVTDETAFVQVKSKAGQSELDMYIDRFEQTGLYDRMFFVCHTPAGTLDEPDDRRLHLWTGDRLAEAAVKAGLFDWLMERSA